MKKLGKEDLYDAITQIDDKYIEEADAYTFKKKFNVVKFSRSLGAVAAVLLVGFVGYMTFFNTPQKTATSTDTTFRTMTFWDGDEGTAMDSTIEEEKSMVESTNGIETDGSTPESAEIAFSGNSGLLEEAWVADSAENRYEYKTVLNSEADSFSGNLLNAVFTQEENTIVSPINVYLAMGMLAEITDGNSRQQIVNTLDETTIEGLRSTANSLFRYNNFSDEMLTSNLAGAIWLSDKYTYRPDTLANLASIYYANSYSGTMGSTEYNEELHRWLNANTGNLLENQVGDINFTKDTNTALTTTIYFKGSWSNEFSKYATAKDTFKAAGGDEEVDFMHKSERGRYYVASNYTAATTYMNGGYSMTFILPKEGITPNDLMKDEGALEFILSSDNAPSSSNCTINYSVPKFDVDSQLELTDIIASMGASDVMDYHTSDFSALTDEDVELFVSEIIHGARVKIDEEGCEAAAYTVIMVDNATAFREETFVDFIVDRPFIFVIRNNAGMPLFVGTVYSIQK